jgi:peptidoglycan/LPS O-acetylase OafA/YrhL
MNNQFSGPGLVAANRLSYMPQIDSLRAISVFIVVLSHFIPARLINTEIDWGNIGVRCFFVISGFLITSTLLQLFATYRPGLAIYIFLLRRASRLFPLLFLTLFLAYILHFQEVRDSFLWHVLYLSNFYFVKIGSWHGVTSHLWTLSVEQQFYLLWPFLLLLFFRNGIKYLLVILIFVAPCFRGVWRLFDLGDIGAWVLPPSSFDALGVGGLLAIMRNNSIWSRSKIYVGVFGLTVWTLSKFPIIDIPFIRYAELGSTGISLFFMWLVSVCANGASGITAKLMSSRALIYTGQISYGIYIFHNFIPSLVSPFLMHRFIFVFPSSVLITLVLASISYRFFETPVRNLLNEVGIERRLRRRKDPHVKGS